jgi:adenosylcobyric acid synthase
LLVADIDRGGVFASVCGTLDLLTAAERTLIRAFAVNRFRGDRSLFDDGVRFLESRAGTACLGVFPACRDIELAAEDGVSLDGAAPDGAPEIAVVRLPHVSNFTDFRLLHCEWITRPVGRRFRWIILPGTKNTLGDLEWLRGHGLERWVLDQHRAGASVLGVCGGYQMLGESIADPSGVEGEPGGEMSGLGLLPVKTVLAASKVTRVVAARSQGGTQFGAYEIHMGRTDRGGCDAFAHIDDGPEGASAGRVHGTYLHGALESPAFVKELLGVEVSSAPASVAYDQLAAWFAASANLRLFEEQFL